MIKAALKFPFQFANPWQNILFISICNLIPVVGRIVLLGYAVPLEKSLIMDLRLVPGPFEFSRFSEYLQRGVVPFVVALIFALAAIPFVLLAEGACFVIAILSRGHPAGITLAVIAFVLFALIFSLVWGLVFIAFNLRAMLLGEFNAVFDMRWATDFAKRVGFTALGNFILLQLIFIPMLVLGMCALYVGMFVVAGYFQMVHWHLYAQLYRLYLDRGGIPLAIRPEIPPPAFPVVMR